MVYTLRDIVNPSNNPAHTYFFLMKNSTHSNEHKSMYMLICIAAKLSIVNRSIIKRGTITEISHSRKDENGVYPFMIIFIDQTSEKSYKIGLDKHFKIDKFF